MRPEWETISAKLRSLSEVPLEPNDAKEYRAGKLDFGKGPRVVLSVSANGVSLITLNLDLLKRLEHEGRSIGLRFEKKEPDEGRDKDAYWCQGLTPEFIDNHLDEFRQLVRDSVEAVQSRP